MAETRRFRYSLSHCGHVQRYCGLSDNHGRVTSNTRVWESKEMLAFSVRTGVIMAVTAAIGSMPGFALAQADVSRPALLEGLLACRAIQLEAERLACFDRASDAFDTAEQQGEVTVVDRAQARETRTRLFGLGLEGANLFGRMRGDDRVEAIETTLSTASTDARGRAVLVLADGSTWHQVDSERINARLSPGAPVRIRQAAVGSFLLSVNGTRSVRARRER